MSESFVCSICGKSHAGLPTDYAFKLPDVLWAIPERERPEKAKFTSDLCQHDGRHFIRCVLYLPLTETSGDFGWGIWVDVEWHTFERYLALYEADGSDEPRHVGKLANALPGYSATLGAKAWIQFRDRTLRPSVRLPPEDQSQLALEQRHGIDGTRYHEILVTIGGQR